MAKATHMLLMEASAGSQVMPFELARGTEKQLKVAYKKWKEKIETFKLIEVPADLPASIGTNAIVSLRITTIPEYVLKAEAIEKKWAGDPKRAKYMQNFTKGAKNLDQYVEQESTDLLDTGFKL